MAMATGRLGSWMALSSIASMARRVWSRLSRGFWYIPPPPVLCSIVVAHTAAHSSRTPDGNTVLHWLVEAAEHLRAFSRYFLCEVHVTQLQLDALYAVLREV